MAEVGVARSQFLVDFTPAYRPHDHRVVSEADVLSWLRAKGLTAEAAHWPDVRSHVGGMGGGVGEIAAIAIGASVAGGFLFGVVGRLAQRLTDDFYDGLKHAVRAMLSRPESQIKKARINVTIELGHGQWIFLWIDKHRIGTPLDKLGDLEVQIDDAEPRLWYIDIDKGEWVARPLLFVQKGPPPSLPRSDSGA